MNEYIKSCNFLDHLHKRPALMFGAPDHPITRMQSFSHRLHWGRDLCKEGNVKVIDLIRKYEIRRNVQMYGTENSVELYNGLLMNADGDQDLAYGEFIRGLVAFGVEELKE